MAFSFNYTTDNGIELVELKDEISGTIVSIAPAHGALLHSFSIQSPTGTHNVIDNYASLEDVQKNLTNGFKSSKLSPFACRINDARYTYNGQLFEFENKFVDGNAIHGLLYNKAFTVTDKFGDDYQASVTLKYHYNKEDAGYPYEYECEVRYSLQADNMLQVQTKIINLHNDVIPVMDGWHPYFTLGGKTDQYHLQFHADAMVEFNDRLVPTGQLLNYDNFNEAKEIGDAALDNCFLLKENFTGAACTLSNETTRLRVEFFPDRSYPFLQIYTPPHRNSIAIENLSGAPDNFNNKMGLVLLPPEHSQTFTVIYKVSAF